MSDKAIDGNNILQVNKIVQTKSTELSESLIAFDEVSKTIKPPIDNPENKFNQPKKSSTISTPKDTDWLKAGDLIDGRYVVVKKIGSGAFAQVFQTSDTFNNNKQFAVKLIKLNQQNLAAQKKSLDMEKEAFAKLSFSENVMGLKGFDIWNNMFYMVIDLVDSGKTFNNKFIYFLNTLSFQEFSYYYKQISQGLYEIHQAEIVHRDIKPANVMVTTDEIVKISDFGISKLRTILLEDSPTSFAFEGTPKFAAPEQTLHSKEFYLQSDIYSVGVMMYISLTGVDPFTLFTNKDLGQEGQLKLAKLHIKEEVKKPSIYNPNILPVLDNIVMKCLAKDMKYRYQNFKDLIDDLDHIEENKNDKAIEVPKGLRDKKLKKTLDKSRAFQYQKFFNKFNWKRISPFFIILAILVVALIVIIIAS